MHQYRLGPTRSNTDLQKQEILEDVSLNVSQQCNLAAMKAACILNYIRKNIACRISEVIFFTLSDVFIWILSQSLFANWLVAANPLGQTWKYIPTILAKIIFQRHIHSNWVSNQTRIILEEAVFLIHLNFLNVLIIIHFDLYKVLVGKFVILHAIFEFCIFCSFFLG